MLFIIKIGFQVNPKNVFIDFKFREINLITNLEVWIYFNYKFKQNKYFDIIYRFQWL